MYKFELLYDVKVTLLLYFDLGCVCFCLQAKRKKKEAAANVKMLEAEKRNQVR